MADNNNKDVPSVRLRSLTSLFVLFLISVVNQADRWVFPALAPAGMRCHVPSTGHCSGSNGSTTEPPPNLTTSAATDIRHTPAMDLYTNSSTSACASDGCVDFNSYDQGFLTGPAFAAVYVLSGIPLSRVADTSSRLPVLALGLLLWSGMVFATGFVHTTWQLYLTRLGLGIGEATCSPVAFSLLSDLFDAKHRALAISIYSSGTYVGASLGNLCGFVSDVLCWRWTYRMLGIIGFGLLPIMCCTLHTRKSKTADDTPDMGRKRSDSDEPMRKESPSINEPSVFSGTASGVVARQRNSNPTLAGKPKHYSLKETCRELLQCYPYLLIMVAASVRFVGGYALGAWCATFYKEHYGESPQSYGIKLFIVFMAGGLPGSILGGFFADRMLQYGAHWKAYVIALTQAVAAPFAAAIFLMPTAEISYIVLTVSFLFSEAWIGVAASIVQDLHKPSLRCQASAVYIAVGTLIGCTGPVLVSAILANQNECHKNYKLAMLYIVPTAYGASAVLFLLTGIVTHYQSNGYAAVNGTAADTDDSAPSSPTAGGGVWSRSRVQADLRSDSGSNSTRVKRVEHPHMQRLLDSSDSDA